MADNSAPPPGFDEYLASQQAPQDSGSSAAAPEGFDDALHALKEEKYGGLGQQAIAAGEGLLSGAVSSPIANVLETKVLGVNPEDIRGRAEANPVTSGASEVAGLVGSSFTPVGQGALLAKAGIRGAQALGAVEKASFLSKVAASATKAAFEGGLYQTGKELGDMVIADPEVGAHFSMADVGLATVLGGVFGGAAGAAAEGFKKAAIEAAPFLKDVQESAGAKALGFTKGQVKKLKGGHEEAKDIARTLMDAELESGEKIITPFAGADELSTKVETLRQEAGAKMSKVYEALDSKGAEGINPLDLAAKIDDKLGKFWRSPINKGESNQLDNILESVTMRGDGNISFKQAQELKEEIQKVAYPNGKNPIEPSPRIQIAQDAYRIVRDEIDTAVDKAAGDHKVLGELQSARKTYGAAKKAGKALADRIASQEGNKLFGLTDTITGVGAASGFGIGPAGAAIALKKLAEKYGNTALASSKDAYLDALSKFTSAFGDANAQNASKLAKATANGFKTAQKATRAIFDKAHDMPSNVIPILSARDKLDKLVSESVKDPNRLFAMNDNNPVNEYSGPYAEASARAVAYLNNLKPKTEPVNPLDSKRVPAASQVSAYNRALGIAQQPLVTMKYIQDGTLTGQDMTTLKTIYPSLYNKMSEQVTEQMIATMSKGNVIPYKIRGPLSLFLGQPLDSTLTAQAIVAAQPTGNAPDMQQQASATAKKPSESSMRGLSKGVKSAATPGQARLHEMSNGK